MLTSFIIADDLTGAADTGLQFHNAGFVVDVQLASVEGKHTGQFILDTNAEPSSNAPTSITLSTETRNRSQANAQQVLSEIGQQLNFYLASNTTPPLLYKKIDSTLRGWIGVEVKSLLDHLPTYIAWIAPSYPKQGRRMRHGVYSIHNKPLHETEYISGIEGNLHNSLVQPLLESQMQELVGFMDCDTLREGTEAIHQAAHLVQKQGRRALIFDAQTDEDLECIAEAGAESPNPVLWVGSAGLAHALATRPANGRHQSQVRELQRPSAQSLVVVAGSRNPVTLRQLGYLQDHLDLQHLMVSMQTQALKDGEQLSHVAPSASYLVTLETVNSGMKDADSCVRDSLVLASRIGKVGAEIITRSQSKMLVLTGGDTAAATWRHLKVGSMQIVGQVEESLPLLQIHGGPADGALVITKAGGFGTDASLYNAVQKLKEYQAV